MSTRSSCVTEVPRSPLNPGTDVMQMATSGEARSKRRSDQTTTTCSWRSVRTAAGWREDGNASKFVKVTVATEDAFNVVFFSRVSLTVFLDVTWARCVQGFDWRQTKETPGSPLKSAASSSSPPQQWLQRLTLSAAADKSRRGGNVLRYF